MNSKHKEASLPEELFINRELSWLEFNQRVLEEAFDSTNPLLERVKFFCIVSSNLDEFFEVRVAGLKQQIESGDQRRSVDGLTPSETYRAISRRAHQLVEKQSECWHKQLVPELARNRIAFPGFADLNAGDLEFVEKYYRTEVRPVLTPLAIDPAHPFPQLLNKSLNTLVRLEMSQGGRKLKHLAVVQVPRVLPRLVQLPRAPGRRDYVFLSHVIGHYLGDLFPGTRILGHWHFRVTRNSELYIDEEEVQNFLKAVEQELHNRRKGDAVRLEVERSCPAELRNALLSTLGLEEEDLYLVNGPVNPVRIMAICDGDHPPELRAPAFAAPIAAALRDQEDIFAVIRSRDVLLHHPFESFESVIDFLESAAADPRVLAIKQTMYRTGGDTRVVGALMNAVKNGKQVTVVVELRARFDEANNIQWARALEEAGVHVVYGLVGFKIHAKMCLVVRRDDDGLRRYVHLGSGNYNPGTARFYTDLGLLTCRPDFGEDVTNLFNLLTGICQFQGTRKLIVAPFELHDRMVSLVDREADHARQGLPARVVAKMNSLVDPGMIAALYRASQAGVRVELIVRGVCCLRPGVPGVSDNIRVLSVVDRFLEHSRIFYFENATQRQVYVGSADWMERNFFRRVEVVFPIEDGVLCERIVHDILGTVLADNVKARRLGADGRYERLAPSAGEAPRRSQIEFVERALENTRNLAGASGAEDGRQIRVELLRRTPR